MEFILRVGIKGALDFSIFSILLSDLLVLLVGVCFYLLPIVFVSGVFIYLLHLFLALFVLGVLGP